MSKFPFFDLLQIVEAILKLLQMFPAILSAFSTWLEMIAKFFQMLTAILSAIIVWLKLRALKIKH